MTQFYFFISIVFSDSIRRVFALWLIDEVTGMVAIVEVQELQRLEAEHKSYCDSKFFIFFSIIFFDS